MLPKLYLGIIALASCCSLQITARAEPVAPRNVPALTREADLIAVGRIGSVNDQGIQTLSIGGSVVPVRRMLAELTVTRILKGELNNTHVWFAFFVSDVRGFQEVSASQFAAFFLRRVNAQEFAVLNPYYPSIVALPTGQIIEGDPLDKVAVELAHVLLTPGTSRDKRIDAIDALDSIDTPTSTAALLRATRTQDLTLKLLASAALLRRNEISTLNTVANKLLQDPQSVGESILWKLSFAIENGVKNPRAIPALSRLVSAGDVRVRRAGAAGLRHSNATDAIPALSKALSDSDQTVRYTAVIGLAEITAQYEWGPSIDLFQREEQRYLAHWKEWTSTK